MTSACAGLSCALAKFVQLWTGDATHEAFSSPRSFQGSTSQRGSRRPRVAAQIRDSGPHCSAATHAPPWAARTAPSVTEPQQLRAEQDSHPWNRFRSNEKPRGESPTTPAHSSGLCATEHWLGGRVILTRAAVPPCPWQSQTSLVKTQDLTSSLQAPGTSPSYLKVTGETLPMRAYAVTLCRWKSTPSVSSSSTTSRV